MPDTPEVLLEFDGVTRHYVSGTRTVRALDGVTLRLMAGEFVAIVGRSGSGKSTMLNLASGIDTPSEGTVRILGSDLAEASDAQRTLWRRDVLGIVFQFFNLLPTLSALENVIFPASIAGRNRGESLSRAKVLLEQFGVDYAAGRYPDQLSGGEQQRVAIARAVMNKPKLILADEPTGNLDHDNALFVMKTLRDLAKVEGCGVLMVTHSTEALEYTDRAIHLRDGRVELPE